MNVKCWKRIVSVYKQSCYAYCVSLRVKHNDHIYIFFKAVHIDDIKRGRGYQEDIKGCFKIEVAFL